MSSSSKEGLLAVAGSLMGLSVIAVSARFYGRKRFHVPVMMDDWMAVCALVSYIGAAISIFIAVHKKVLGYSSHDFTPDEIAATAEDSSKLQIALDVFTTTTLGFTKLSALFFYRRLFCVSGLLQPLDIVINITIAIVVLWLFAFNFLTGFQCGTHLPALWDGTYTDYCHISFQFLYGLAVSDFLLDIWILALPIPSIVYLRAPVSRKLSIMGLFLLSFVGLGASIARMVLYIRVSLDGLDALLADQERSITQTFYFAMLEAGMSLLAVNIPSLWVYSSTATAGRIYQSLRSVMSFSSSERGTDSAGTSPTLEASDDSVDSYQQRPFKTAAAAANDLEASRYVEEERTG